MTDVNDKETAVDVEEVLIDQNHERGPGWFLLATYVVVTAFCLFYLFTHWNWKSDYEEQQEQQRAGVEQVLP